MFFNAEADQCSPLPLQYRSINDRSCNQKAVAAMVDYAFVSPPYWI